MNSEVQIALRNRLIATPELLELVPAANILDTNQRPAPVPSILMGESQNVDEGNSIKRRRTRIYHTLHIWTREPSLKNVKLIADKLRLAVKPARLVLQEGLHCADLMVSSTRFMRDPDGEHSHGIVTVEALIVEVTE